jgi:GNAT superfamily N-acetyltransferase
MTTVIRAATLADVPRLVAMGRRFCAEPIYRDVWPENVAQLEAMATRLVTGPASVVLVAERDAQVVGMLGLLLYPHHLSGVWVAGEIMWWVEPEARGAGLALLRHAEAWAAEAGAEQIHMVAPDARVGSVYQRRGYRRIEETYARPVTPAMTALHVVDDVLPDVADYRARVLAQPFGDVEPRPGLVFHGIAPAPDDAVTRWITTHVPGVTPTLSFVRQSPAGQDEPHYIHTDADMGDWTAIAYLTADPPPGDGTTFWRSRATGAIQNAASGDETAAWADLTAWVPWQTVPARPNRLVLFPSRYYHSRALPDNYGTGDTARLIHVVFGTGALAPGGASPWRLPPAQP